LPLEASKLPPAKRLNTRSVYAVELGYQLTPLSKLACEVAVQNGQSVVIRVGLGAFAPSIDTLCHDRLLFALSARRTGCINDSVRKGLSDGRALMQARRPS